MSGPWIKANWKWSNGMARVNIDILGIRELKWTGMGEFNSDDHYIYYCRQESLRSSHHGQKKSPKCSTWMQFQKWQNVRFQGKPFNITVIQVYTPTNNAEEAEVERFYEDLQDLLELTSEEDALFHHRGLESKSRKSRNTWSNRQIWPWSTEWSRPMANRVLPREHTGHSKHPLPTTQEKTLHMVLHMDITRWSISKSDWLYSL